ncbi:integrin-linked protein kinase isoform X1 [Pogoniulus pusillus]|uniref:integrin-linked protein kinase isoform X1 n=1 Tax=Pogoniulus pusillus TaxID=488313 RepID=UPI0030B9282E
MDDIFTQCREGNAVAVRLWLDNTENDLNQGDDHGFSPLHWACREGRASLVDMLIMRGARINVLNRGDDTPLHLAASHGHRHIVQKLLQFKADINAVNEHGNSALHYACFWGHQQVAEDLVGSGALVSVANKYGETPLEKAKLALRQLLRERAEQLGQSLTKIPYKDTFWKGTTRTRPRNGTLNKLAGIDFKQLSLSQKLNENQSGELWRGRWQGTEVAIKVLKVRDWSTRKSRDFSEEYPRLRLRGGPDAGGEVCAGAGTGHGIPAHPGASGATPPPQQPQRHDRRGPDGADQHGRCQVLLPVPGQDVCPRLGGARGAAAPPGGDQPALCRHVELRPAALGAGHARGALRRPLQHGDWHEGGPGGAAPNHPPWHLATHLQADEDLHERGPCQAPQVRHDRAHPREDAGQVGHCQPCPSPAPPTSAFSMPPGAACPSPRAHGTDTPRARAPCQVVGTRWHRGHTAGPGACCRSTARAAPVPSWQPQAEASRAVAPSCPTATPSPQRAVPRVPAPAGSAPARQLAQHQLSFALHCNKHL